MIDWIGYGWIAGEVSGSKTYFADLTIEVPRGDVVAAAAVTGFSVGVQKNEPGSVAVYIREYARFKSSTLIDVVDVPPDPTNNVLPITDCAFVRFRMTVFQGRAFSQGLVWRFAPKALEPPRAPTPKFSVHEFHVRVGGRIVGGHRVVALPKDSRLPIDSILDRSAGEAARFLGVRPREIETIRARSRGKGSGAASARLAVF